MHHTSLTRQSTRPCIYAACRYILRPAICLKRLSTRTDVQIAWLLERA